MKLKCNGCQSHVQDKMHGPGVRIMNATVKDNEYRCTVCGKITNVKK